MKGISNDCMLYQIFLVIFYVCGTEGIFFCEKDKIFENCVDHSTLNGLKMGGDKKLIEI